MLSFVCFFRVVFLLQSFEVLSFVVLFLLLVFVCFFFNELSVFFRKLCLPPNMLTFPETLNRTDDMADRVRRLQMQVRVALLPRPPLCTCARTRLPPKTQHTLLALSFKEARKPIAASRVPRRLTSAVKISLFGDAQSRCSRSDVHCSRLVAC